MSLFSSTSSKQNLMYNKENSYKAHTKALPCLITLSKVSSGLIS